MFLFLSNIVYTGDQISDMIWLLGIAKHSDPVNVNIISLNANLIKTG